MNKGDILPHSAPPTDPPGRSTRTGVTWLGIVPLGWHTNVIERSSDFRNTSSLARLVFPKSIGKWRLSSEVRTGTFKKSISKKHTNRYLTATNQSSSRVRCELLSDGLRWVFPRDRSVCKFLMTSLWRACLRINYQVCMPGESLVLIGFHQSL